MSDLSDKTVIVVGASRGLGRGVAAALAEAGAQVVAVARDAAALADLAVGTDAIRTEAADAGEDSVAGTLLDRYDPDVVVVVAGATPHMVALQEQTWETFAVNWETDVRITFQWLRAILVRPLKPGSRVIVFSSGAALAGSPLSGGYAGAKATQRFITGYAQGEAKRDGLDLTFTSVLPRFAPMTGVGGPAVAAYAGRGGVPVDEFLKRLGPLVSPEVTGAAVLELLQADADTVAPAYELTGEGLKTLG